MKIKIKNKRGFLTALTLIGATSLILIWLFLNNNVVNSIANLPIKKGPGIQYKTVKLEQPGHRLQLLGEKNDWYRVVYDHQKIGFVPSWLVRNPKVKAATPLSEMTIVLDAGHGGSDSGAQSTNGADEKNYTLVFAKKLQAKLEDEGARVIMVRNRDKTVSLYDRPSFADHNNANLYISFHFDSSPSDNTASGFTTYYYHPGKSKQLAIDVNRQFVNLPLFNRGVQFGNFLVVRDIKTPSVLLEMGYINNNRDFAEIKNSKYQNQVTKDLMSGLTNYAKQVY